MSSSVFIESASRRTTMSAGEQCGENDEEAIYNTPNSGAADANLVVVLKNDRVHVDSDGLERFIEDKTISSLSVIRITSPTPSMVDEAREEADAEMSDKGDDSRVSGEDTSSVNTDLDVSVGNESSENAVESGDRNNRNDILDEGKKHNKKKKKKKNEKEVVGLEVEKYYVRAEAEKIIKNVLQKAGLLKQKRTPHQEFLLSVIKNDHCYTPYDSPSKVKHINTFNSDQVHRNQSSTISNATRQLYVKKIQQPIVPLSSQPQTNEDKKSSIKESDVELVDEDDFHTSNAEEEEDSEYDSANFISSDTDNDRDSDLDFKVNNNTSTKKMGRRKRKMRRMKKRRRYINMKNKNIRRVSNDGDDISSFPKSRIRKAGPTPSSVPVTPEPIVMRLNRAVQNVPRSKIQAPPSVITPTCSVANIKRVPVVSIPSTINPSLIVATTPIILEEDIKPTILVNFRNHDIRQPRPPQGVREIVISKRMNNARGTFTNIDSLLEENTVNTSLLTREIGSKQLMSLMPDTNKSFMALDTALKHQLPAQISIQTHSGTPRVSEENDKQLDLIDSLVTDALENTNIIKDNHESKIADKSIPDIVKMLEGEGPVMDIKNTLNASSSFVDNNAINSSSFVVNNTNMNAVDLISPDILDHVTDILKNDPALQQVVMDDSVFSEHNESEVTAYNIENSQLSNQIGDVR